MQKTYDPKTIETTWYQTWESQQAFKANKQGLPYCIMLPPPNVTGSLHMGHGFQQTLMDVLIRYHRMLGDNTLWQVGVDHAGIATQMVVERQLLQQGKTRHDLGREAFVEKIWAWKQQSGNMILQQMRRLGVSADWSRERFTMDKDFVGAVEKVFIDLYNENLIYRGQRLVNWDPQLLTAISDLEVIASEEQGQLWYIRYPLTDGSGQIIVATTRPETMFGDVAVAVHPDDARYQKLLGKHINLPLTDRTIPIIADEMVDPTFGTGCVKITPAHDFNDYAMGQRHQLPLINIFTPNAHLNTHAPTAYQGLERFAARKKIIQDLEKLHLIEKIEPHVLKIPRGDRSGVIIEPYLTNQWFMKMQPLAEPAIAAVKNGDIKFYPENWNKIYFQWLENIEDWCISRQLWWGHRIPAWYDDKHNIYVGNNETEVRAKYNLGSDIYLQQDTDVLDTWFSSALWPFATLGWPQQTIDLKTFYPTSVLVTGFDIIFFWVARMVMLGLKFTQQVPFKAVYVHGLIRDHEGQKMSKSKGNVLDPLDIIDGVNIETLLEKRTSGLMQPEMAKKIEQATRKQFANGIAAFGTDALRFTYCALASNNRDIKFDLARVEGYRNFCNKLWNAARFVLMNTEKQTLAPASQLNLIDQWIHSQLQNTIQQVHQHFQDYRFDLVAQILYEFTWNEYCDWYVELAKAVLNDPKFDNDVKNSTRFTLINLLETILRLLHPLMPFITEEIWQTVAPLANKTANTLMLQKYPIVDATQINVSAETEITWLKNIIIAIRTIRSEMSIAPGKRIPLLLSNGDASDKQRVQDYQLFISMLAKVESIRWLNEHEPAPQAAMGLVGNLKLLIPMANLIDVAVETARIQKELEKLIKELNKSTNKLNTESFIKNAPEAVVIQEKSRKTEFEAAINKLKHQLNDLQATH